MGSIFEDDIRACAAMKFEPVEPESFPHWLQHLTLEPNAVFYALRLKPESNTVLLINESSEF